ncbi:coniferyl aldehyde dehydrogenase [Vibrio sp.]|nr:coniferyl aldehyde dehydrogenase [Vibrio sp.]
MTSQPTKNEMLSTLKAMQKDHTSTGAVDVSVRQDRLQRSIKLIKENYQQLSDAMSADFGHRSHYQSLVADMATTVNMLQHAHDNVATWMKPDHVENLPNGLQAWIQQQPIGVVGVISPWNFPINLSFGPLAGIFAAGNTAILKPSELTPKTSALLASLIERYFAPTELTVMLGDDEVGRHFSELPFNHLVFTGSTQVGKHVMKAAAENLVPVTLELGGKSPVVIDSSANIQQAAERTMTIKTFNVGQICLSPDYVLLPEGQEDEFISAAKAFVASSFDSVQTNDDYTSIISQRHFNRLVGLLEDAINKGARVVKLVENEPAYDENTRKIAPHLILNVTDDMGVMQEELFGPLLPIKTYSTSEEYLNYINERPRPLAAYFFGDNSERQERFAHCTTSGALVINDVMTHASIDALPFGGVGASGIGAYHGIHGFRQFTHAKPVVVQSEEGLSNLRLRAPYKDNVEMLEAFLNN